MIRQRRANDLPECAAVLLEVHTRFRYPIHWPDDASEWLTPVGPATAWVAVQGERVVGHACVTRGDPTGDGLALERLFVSPSATGAGVGAALISRASDWATEAGQPLTLEVAENCTAAIRLYERLGWHMSGRTPIAWGDDTAQYLLHYEAP